MPAQKQWLINAEPQQQEGGLVTFPFCRVANAQQQQQQPSALQQQGGGYSEAHIAQMRQQQPCL